MKTTFCILFSFAYLQTSAQLHLSAIFSDHMILQRDKPLIVWGFAKPGESVRADIGGLKRSILADKNGSWRISFPSFSAGGPYTLSIRTKTETKIYSDVLFGEVWLCSGQSNMEFKVGQALQAQFEIHRANNSMIRQLSIPKKLSFNPEQIIDSTAWVISSPQTTGAFTAVGYFFARDVYERLHVPIGIIDDSWGGSQVESWISKEAMMTSDDLRAYAQQMPDAWAEADTRIEKKYQDLVFQRAGGKMPDLEESTVLKSDYSFSDWLPAAAPTAWDWVGLPAYRGQGYMVREIYLDSIQSAKSSTIGLGERDERFKWFVNGKKLPATQEKNVLVPLLSNTWKAGRNVILLEIGPQSVPDWQGVGIQGESDRLFIDFDGEKIPLADNNWKMLPRLDKPHHFVQWMNSEGTIIYNAMIHPLIPFSIRGVLWYQGESNTGRAFEYGKTFPLMIESWRKEWKDNFPFLFVQLSSFGSNEISNGGSDWAELREAQVLTLRLSNTGMTVTTDIGDPADIHPKNKQEVGRRLAVIAQNNVYGIRQIISGPVYESVSFSKDQAILSFSSFGKGLWARNKYGNLYGFEIAGTDRKFYWARALIQGDRVVVSADSVLNPVAVRYGWTNAPIDINLYNIEGFPASPFRTDKWPGITETAGFYKPLSH